jgi:lipid-binding SYLF domain-containing protein
VVKADEDDNADLYGPDVTAHAVVMGGTIEPPSATEPFMAALRRGAAK